LKCWSDEEDTIQPSDTEEEDDDDPDGMLEADLDKNEMIQPHDADLVGDEFLRVHYSMNVPSSQRKKRVCFPFVFTLLVIISYVQDWQVFIVIFSKKLSGGVLVWLSVWGKV